MLLMILLVAQPMKKGNLISQITSNTSSKLNRWKGRTQANIGKKKRSGFIIALSVIPGYSHLIKE